METNEKKQTIEQVVQEIENQSEIFQPTSLGRVETPEERNKRETAESNREAIAASGWQARKSIKTTPFAYINISIEDLPSRGKFYPNDLFIQIRSAEIKEIEHWSTMNDADPIDAEYHLNDILRSCARASSEIDRMFTILDLIEGDRLFVILAIKDKTFIESENAIPISIECSHCGHTNTRTLKNNVLDASSESDETVEKYYDEKEKAYLVKTKSYGVIKMRPPRIELVEYIYKRGRKTVQQGKYWDKSFFTLLPFIFTKESGEIKDLDVDTLYNDYSRWDKKKFSVVYKMAEKIKVGVKPSIKIQCDNEECGKIIESPFRGIPGGTKALFIIQDNDDELI